MLILHRRIGEKICINGHWIEITVIKMHGGNIWLGFDAPADVAIHRAEVQARVDAGESKPNSGAVD